MDYFFTPRAKKDFAKLEQLLRHRVIRKIEFYLSAKDPLVHAKTLTNSPFGTHRFRVAGKIRVIFVIEPKGKQIVITRLRFRRESY